MISLSDSKNIPAMKIDVDSFFKVAYKTYRVVSVPSLAVVKDGIILMMATPVSTEN